MMRLLRRTLLYLAANLIDIHLTVQGTKTHPEGNPFSEAWMILCGPFVGLAFYKGLIILSVVIWIYFVRIKTRMAGAERDYSWVLNYGALATLIGCSLWFTKG